MRVVCFVERGSGHGRASASHLVACVYVGRWVRRGLLYGFAGCHARLQHQLEGVCWASTRVEMDPWLSNSRCFLGRRDRLSPLGHSLHARERDRAMPSYVARGPCWSSSAICIQRHFLRLGLRLGRGYLVSWACSRVLSSCSIAGIDGLRVALPPEDARSTMRESACTAPSMTAHFPPPYRRGLGCTAPWRSGMLRKLAALSTALIRRAGGRRQNRYEHCAP